MELITTTCPACGGSIHVQSNQKQCYCTFCGSQVLIDNGEKTFTYRTVDEARLRELELENKRLEMAERHRPQRMKMALGLALVGAVKGYRTIIIMPDSVSEERAKLVRHYGAEVRLIHDAGDIGACIDECLQTALRMQKKDPKVFVPQQFSNPNNTMAQKNFTAQEILEQVNGPIDGFCSGIGTGGTLTGIGEVLKEHNPNMEIWAVEPENAAILAGGTIGTHMQMGIGDGIIPDILNREIYDEICVTTDTEAIETSKRLAREEGLMVGISSGTNVAAALKLAAKLGEGKTVVTVLPDTAERYFSTPLFGE